MDLSFSGDQALLHDTARRFLAQHGPTPKAGSQANRSLWPEFAKMGWLALPISEGHGGLGQGPVDVGILMEAFGRSLVTEPYLSTVVLCAGLIASVGSEAQRQAILPGIAEGTTQLSLAHVEEGARYNLSHVETSARRSNDGWILSGRKLAVLGSAQADHLLVSARVSGATRDAAGIGIFLVGKEFSGLVVDRFATVDGAGAAVVTLKDVAVGVEALLGGNDNVLPHLETGFDRTVAASCAEMVGIMDALIAATVEYTNTRVQFGHPLSANQVVRHRLADMSMACEEARSMALRASLFVDDENPDVRSRAVAGAKNKVSRAARFVAEQAVQLHGGMGVTDELNIGFYLKRVLALDALFGPAEYHLRRHVELSGQIRQHAA